MGEIIAWIVFGFLAGLIARALLPGRQKLGFIWTIVLGVAGAVIGGFIATAVGLGDGDKFDFGSFIVAVITAIGLLAIGERLGIGAGDRREGLGAGGGLRKR